MNKFTALFSTSLREKQSSGYHSPTIIEKGRDVDKWYQQLASL